MNLREHLLITFSEECSELTKQVSKILRFGLINYQPASGKLNVELLNEEWNDLVAMKEMLEENGIPIIEDREKIQAKKNKVTEHLEISRKAGTLK